MSANSKIEWTHHTFNPWWGCTKVSDGCKNCYAEGTANRYGHDVWGPGAARRFFGDKHWAEPLKWDAAAARAGTRERVFCASMADVFEDREDLLPWLWCLVNLIRLTPHLDWLLVTKRPEGIVERLTQCARHAPETASSHACAAVLDFIGVWIFQNNPPKNVCLLTSVENQETADQRIPELLKVPAAVHGLSCEPLLGPVTLRSVGPDSAEVLAGWKPDAERANWIDWVIAGGESGPKARPMHPDWARSLRDQCQAAHVPFFFKQWGEWVQSAWDGAPAEGVGFNGRCGEPGYEPAAFMRKVGKKSAGRHLDGRTWDEFPQPVTA